jgi:hypothetical protein
MKKGNKLMIPLVKIVRLVESGKSSSAIAAYSGDIFYTNGFKNAFKNKDALGMYHTSHNRSNIDRSSK